MPKSAPWKHATPAVAAVFGQYPPAVRRHMEALRALILRTAAATDGVGLIEETLKWGEPAYLTSETGAGTTVRLGWSHLRPDEFCLLFNCRTTLIDSFRADFGSTFRYDGTRALIFQVGAPVPEQELVHCIEAALTYHRRRKVTRARS